MSDRILLKGNSKLLKPIITEILALHQLIESKDIGTIYAHHDDLEKTRRTNKPKVTIYFLEDTDFNKKAPPNKIAEGQRRKDGLIRFRIMNETTQTFSKSNATILANKIKQVFGANGGFVWNKGKTLYTYCDWDLGYQFQLLCRTETEAKRIITATLSLQSHSPIWTNFNTVKNDEELIKYPESPGNISVMGELMPLPQERPIVDVRFQYAYVKLSGVKEPINLYSLNKRRVGNLAH